MSTTKLLRLTYLCEPKLLFIALLRKIVAHLLLVAEDLLIEGGKDVVFCEAGVGGALVSLPELGEYFQVVACLRIGGCLLLVLYFVQFLEKHLI